MKAKARSGRDSSSIVVLPNRDGSLSWRAIDRDGRPMRLMLGKIHGIDTITPQAKADHELSLRVLDRVLKQHGAKKLRKAHVRDKGHAAPASTRRKNALSAE
jgi:hypothetical protein